MKKAIIIFILVAIILSMAYGIMQFLAAQKQLPKASKLPEVVRYVKSEEVNYDNISAIVSARGRVNAIAVVDVVAEGSGKILPGNVLLKKGQTFKKGDLLLSIYKEEVELTLQSQKSKFMKSVADLLPDIKIDFKESFDDFELFFNEIDVKKSLPVLPSITSSQLKLFLASRGVLSEYYSIIKDEKAIARYSIYAPFNGSFLDVYMEAGAYTNVGGKIAKAIRTDIVEIEVPVEIENASFIKIGDAVTLEADGVWLGKVNRTSEFIDEETQARSIFVRVSNYRSPKLLAGQYVNVLFKGMQLQKVMEVPRNAVFNSDEIYTITDGRLHKRVINIVKRNESTLYFNGLSENVVVVTQPLIGVNDGMKVSRLEEAVVSQDEKKQVPNQSEKEAQQ